MTTVLLSGHKWHAISPSIYTLDGYPVWLAYNGQAWYLVFSDQRIIRQRPALAVAGLCRGCNRAGIFGTRIVRGRSAVTFPIQKSFGDFIKERVGTKWVYASQRSKRIATQYPGSKVILPAQQRELAVTYKREWGAEHDSAAWMALCALRAASSQVDFCGFDVETKTQVLDAIEALTGSAAR